MAKDRVGKLIGGAIGERVAGENGKQIGEAVGEGLETAMVEYFENRGK